MKQSIPTPHASAGFMGEHGRIVRGIAAPPQSHTPRRTASKIDRERGSLLIKPQVQYSLVEV